MRCAILINSLVAAVRGGGVINFFPSLISDPAAIALSPSGLAKIPALILIVAGFGSARARSWDLETLRSVVSGWRIN